MQNWLDNNFPSLVYPVTMLFSLLLHTTLLATGQSLVVSGYLPVLFAALLVSVYEWRYPASQDWWPDRGELLQDVIYMLVVQVGVARLLSLLTVVLFAQWLEAEPSLLWPHNWPLLIQFLLMVLAADFLRYWLHRLAHWHPLLWRLHAVHHSPKRLYWVNVGRFHPLEKILQFFFDALPFILLGVSEQVITLYFVFYSINGFFQHSNITLNMGWLNYVISTAELHRWHHSKFAEESNTNFGNNVIIWDILFGTRFLPKERKVDKLGLINREYPLDFLRQCLTPFTPELDNRTVPLHSMTKILRRLMTWAGMQWVRISAWWPLYWQAKTPLKTQQSVLRSILRKNKNTVFGREHSFKTITSIEDFQRLIPIHDYEKLRWYVEQQELNKHPALTIEQPFMYAVTSGTTGQPKYLPVLRSSVRHFQAEQRLFSWILYQHCPSAFYGKLLGFVSSAEEGRRPSGLPYGSVSGHIYASMPRFLQKRILVPPAVYALHDYVVKYRIMLYLSLLDPGITYIGGANPSSCLRLLKELEDSWELLASCLESGSIAALGDIPETVLAHITPRIKKDPLAAQQLRAAAKKGALDFKTLWPDIRLMTIWTSGSCGVALAALATRLPEHTQIVELGYVSSEFRGTITIDVASGAGLPTLQHHFFEFIEPAHWDAHKDRYMTLDQIEEGHDYYVIVTTSSGLYRYFMNDIVHVQGMFANTATMKFVQKGRGVTSITGEKLYENQLLQAISEVAHEYGFEPEFVMGLADTQRNRYDVYVESSSMPGRDEMSEGMDAALKRINLEYLVKRDSGRLAAIRWHWLKSGSGDAYKHACLEQGQREGQFKTVALHQRDNFDFDLDARVQPEARDSAS